jgi:hypothetical protein
MNVCRLLALLLVLVLATASACRRDDRAAPPTSDAANEPAVAAVSAVAPPSPAVPVFRDPAFAALAGARAEYGVHEGAAYRIEVPERWNGALVLFAHGYRGEGPELSVSNPPLRRHLIANGYAWAASSYRANGYRPDLGVLDTLALRELFIQRHGQPRWSVLVGESMGGHVLVSSLEQHPGVYQGGLASCGAVSGIGAVEYLAAFGAAAEYVGGVPLFDAPDARVFIGRVFNEWLPVVGLGGAPTERGRAFQSTVKYLMGGDLPYWREGLAARLTQVFNVMLLANPDRAGALPGSAVDTRDVQYRIDPGHGISAEALNAGVRRFSPSQTAPPAAFAPLTGRLSAPVLSLHTTGDAFVPFSVQQEYRRTVEAAGGGGLLVQRAIRRPNHCEFQPAELTRAFDDLVAWVERGVRPEGDDVLAPDMAALGLRWTEPLRPDDPLRPPTP